MATKWVYMFKEGNATMRNLLGGKGANLAEMTGLGLPVPQGFTVTTEACTQYYEDGRQINDEIMGQIMDAMAKLEEITGKKFGDKENPLLVSVRSGARASMPGMMDTILNLGLNEEVVEALAEASGNPRWAWHLNRTALIHLWRPVNLLYPVNGSINHRQHKEHLTSRFQFAVYQERRYHHHQAGEQ